MSELTEREKVEIIKILFEEGVELTRINKMINMMQLSSKSQEAIAEFFIQNGVEIYKINEIINIASLPLKAQIGLYGKSSNNNVEKRIKRTLSEDANSKDEGRY